MPSDLTIEAKDGYPLTATVFEGTTDRYVVIGSASAVPRRFYRHIAQYLQEWGATVVTFDYRGIGDSRPKSLRGFKALFSEWGLLDIAGVLEWVRGNNPEKLYLLGHSAGGQVAALAGKQVDGMVTISAQSGYWGLQGGWQKLWVCLHMYTTFPILTNLFGYLPWSMFGNSEDLPKGVALEWARWCRDPKYLYGDKSLPLELYGQFQAPVLAYSIEDDSWGTSASVDLSLIHI